MTTLTLELTDEQAQQLAEEAERVGLTLPEFALRKVLTPWQFTEDSDGNPRFEEAMNYVFQKNAELYERLSGRKEHISQAIGRIIKENEELYRRLA